MLHSDNDPYRRATPAPIINAPTIGTNRYETNDHAGIETYTERSPLGRSGNRVAGRIDSLRC